MEDQLRKLEVLIGTWHTTISMLDGEGREVGTSQALDIYRWSPNGRFVFHDVDAQMNGERIQSMEIIALAPQSDGFNARSYEPDGTFADYHAEIVGRNWNITGETLRFRGGFSPDGKILTGQWDQISDGVWQGIMRVSLQKQP